MIQNGFKSVGTGPASKFTQHLVSARMQDDFATFTAQSSAMWRATRYSPRALARDTPQARLQRLKNPRPEKRAMLGLSWLPDDCDFFWMSQLSRWISNICALWNKWAHDWCNFAVSLGPLSRHVDALLPPEPKSQHGHKRFNDIQLYSLLYDLEPQTHVPFYEYKVCIQVCKRSKEIMYIYIY